MNTAVTQQTPESMLRIGTTMGTVDVLHSLGFDPRVVLLESGFDLGLFDDPDNVLTYTARSRLLAHCAATTRCPHFGLLVGQRDGLHSLGLLGLLAKYSPDVGSALKNLVHYFHLHVRGAALTLDVQGGIAILNYQINESGAKASDQVGDGAVAAAFNILRELCGPDWKPTEVWLMHRMPTDMKPWRHFFKSVLRFDAEQNAIVFHSSWLQHPIPDAHADVRLSLQKQIDELATRHSGNFPEQVRAVLRATLASGDANAEQVATLFSMHPRTLNRRLQACGIGYQALVDETRFEIAQQQLCDSDLSVGQVALMLQYADARSFIRAFRRWSGTTPARWRRLAVGRSR